MKLKGVYHNPRKKMMMRRMMMKAVAATLRSILLSIFNFLGFAQTQLRETGQITSLTTSQSAVFALCRSKESKAKIIVKLKRLLVLTCSQGRVCLENIRYQSLDLTRQRNVSKTRRWIFQRTNNTCHSQVS